jgi:phosphopentomutase
MAHSVTPERHGLLTNTYVPEVRPVMGIFEKVALAGGVCCMFYGWENLRDIARPGAMKFTTFINCYMNDYTDVLLTDDALFKIEKYDPDLAFLYLVDTDDKGGHDSGWMTEEYLKRVSVAVDCVKRVFDKFGADHSIIIMADHGGHDRSHGTNSPEDMTVPFFYYGKRFTPGLFEGGSLTDIAPTIADLFGLTPEPEWEGKSFAE